MRGPTEMFVHAHSATAPARTNLPTASGSPYPGRRVSGGPAAPSSSAIARSPAADLPDGRTGL